MVFSLVSRKVEWKTKFSVHIGSDWPDFKFGVQNGVCRNDIFFNWKEEFCLLYKISYILSFVVLMFFFNWKEEFCFLQKNKHFFA